MKHGSAFCGHMPIPLGSFVYQQEGQRLLATVDTMDLMSHMPEIPEYVTAEMGSDLLKVSWLVSWWLVYYMFVFVCMICQVESP